jgi:murein DD-endopeptidase MepM/ murein hydrolase activator NlpD
VTIFTQEQKLPFLTFIQILVLACFTLLSPVTHAYCIDNWACFNVIKRTHNIEFWLSNKKPFPITATLKVKANNLSSLSGTYETYSETRVLVGEQRLLVLTLSTTNKAEPSDYTDEFYWTPGILDAKHNSAYRYALPYAQDTHHTLVQGFGGGYSHFGASRFALDFAMPVGTEVYAAREGQVIDIQAKHNRGGPSRGYSRYANFITILHDDGTTGEYYHLKQDGVAVALGAKINRGQLIGYSGNTGFSSLPHLHFAVYQAKSHGEYASIEIAFSQPLRQPNE